MILLVDPRSLEIVTASKAIAKKLGFEQHELIGKQILDIDTDITAMFFWEAMKNGTENGIIDARGYFLSSSDMEIPVSKTVERITDGDRDWLIVHADDISETRKNEDILTHLSAQLKATLEATGDGLLVIDQQGRYINMNHRFTDMWSLSQDTLDKGKQAIDQWLEYQLSEKSPVKDIHACLSGPVSPDSPLTLELKSGQVFELKIQPQVILDKLSGYVLSFHDVTEHVRYKEALIIEREKADEANRAKTEFLSNMSHELRTPLNAILGFGQILLIDIPDDDPGRENLNEIINAGQHLLKLINEILDLAKVESGRIELSIDTFNINDVLGESISLVSTLAASNNISLTLHDSEDVSIKTDRLRLRQALLNLLSNAIKYNSENGSVEVAVTSHADRLQIDVKDTGIGIKPEQMKDLFEPFNRLDAEGSDIEGTGIGLTLTRRIIRMMGGSLNVESQAGIGSTFSISLPVDNTLRQIDTSDNAIHLQEALSEIPDGRPSKVLYIEDDAANIKLISQLLARRPHIQLLTSMKPVEGIEMAFNSSPDVILLDTSLPGMDGYEVLEVLRNEAQFKATPIIAISANAMQSDIEKGIKAGFDEFLTKPLVIEEFYEIIDKLTCD